MMLFEEGKFQLNDPVSRFIPSWKGQQVWVAGRGDDMQTRAPQSVMTMRHVLSHTSGLSYGALLPGDSQPVDEVYQKLGVNRGEGETVSSFAEKLSQCASALRPRFTVAVLSGNGCMRLLSGIHLRPKI